MENPEVNMKPQQTGGLKLMTVFVVVLALHVVVIGGMTTYYLLKGGSTDASLTDDKHKGLKANADGSLAVDSSLPDADKTTPAPSTDASSTTTASTTTPATTTTATPASDQTASNDTTPAPSAPVAQTPAPASTGTPAALTPPPDVTAPAVVVKPTPSVSTPDLKTSPVMTPATPDVTQTTPAPVTGGTPYTVVSHDSLAKIAHKNHISVANLMAANSMTSDKLSIGQKLVIPAKTPAPAELGTAEAVAPATSTTDVATTTPAPTPIKDTGSVPATDKKAKKVAADKPAAAKSVSDKHTYTIAKGDTLTKIAHKFKTTASALMAANNISDPTKLKIGSKLMIPAKEAHTATVTTPAPVQPAVVTKKAAAQLANNVQ
jgi:LysM repeat protein